MHKREPADGELDALWDKTGKFWEDTKPHIEGPWVEYKFRLALFKTLLSQLDIKIPLGMR